MIKIIPSLCIGFALLSAGCGTTETKTGQAFFNALKTEKVKSSDDIVWKNFGPGMSGYCQEFWCHPTDPKALFMGPDMHVSYGTWDGGDSWQGLKDPDGMGDDMKRVLDIEFSLQDPNLGMALDWNGWVYKTQDKGRSWQKISELSKTYKELGVDPFDDRVFYEGWYADQLGLRHSEIAVDPNDDTIWYVGAGDFWDVKGNHRSLEHPHGTLSKFAAHGYIMKTRDRGKTWQKITAGLPENLVVGKIIVNPNNSQQLVMAANTGLYLSMDGGLNWNSSSRGLPNNLPRDMTAYHDKNTGEFVLYLAEQTVFEPNGKSLLPKGGIYKSTDGGLNWVSITGNIGIDFNRINDPIQHNNYHRAVSHWLGENSKKRYPVFPKNTYPVFNRIRVNPKNKNEIYLVANQRHDKSFGPGDVWKTEDGGETWTIVARSGTYWRNETDKEYWLSRGNDIGANVEFAHLQNHIDHTHETQNGNRMLAVNADGDVFIGVNQQTLRSNDGGKTWQQVDDFETAPGSENWIGRGASNLPGRVMVLETGKKDRYLFASGEHGLWQSADLGNWPDKDAVALKQIEGQAFDVGDYQSAHSIAALAVHPKNADIIYILVWRQYHMGKVRRSLDGGKTWENIATVFERDPKIWLLEQPVAYQNSLMFDYQNPDIMYFCSTRKAVQEIHGSVPENSLLKGKYGVYKSTDMGFNWQLMNEGLPADASVRRLTMDPKNPKIIYASLNQKNPGEPGGLYKSVDGALSWKKMDTVPANVTSVNNLFIDRNTGDLFLSAGSRFGDVASGGVWRSRDNAKTWVRIFEAPYVWQTEVSPVNSDIILISVPAQRPEKTDQFKNPGIYLSQDGAKSWLKINQGLLHQDKMVDIKPDPYDANILWSAGWGSGWYKAKIK